MKPIQYYLEHVDREQLLHKLSYDYISHPKNLMNNSCRTVQEILNRYEEGFSRFIDTLIATDAKMNNDIFLLYDIVDNSSCGFGLDLCDVREIMYDVHAAGYRLETFKNVYTLGCRVADTKLTQDNIYVLLRMYLQRIALFESPLEEMRSEMTKEVDYEPEERKEGTDEGTKVSAKETHGRIYGSNGRIKLEKDAEQDRLRGRVNAAERNYNFYSLIRERKRVLEGMGILLDEERERKGLEAAETEEAEYMDPVDLKIREIAKPIAASRGISVEEFLNTVYCKSGFGPVTTYGDLFKASYLEGKEEGKNEVHMFPEGVNAP